MSESFSNKDKNVFIIKTGNQADNGALMARYSRSKLGMRETYIKEFETNPSRGEQFYKKVLAEYGDDSVAELGEAQIGIENISNIAAQFIEDSRIGLSFLEKSSRYVELNSYYIPKNLDSLIEEYKYSCDFSLQQYEKISNEMEKYLKELYPIESIDYGGIDNEKMIKNIYNSTIRGKKLDLTRGLLPASINTNLGINGNGRAFEYLITKMKSSDIIEIKELGEKIQKELNLIIKPFLSRIDSEYGKEYQNYLKEIQKSIVTEYKSHINEIIEKDNKLVSKNPQFYNNYVKYIEGDIPFIAEVNIISNLIYENVDRNISFESISEWIKKLNLIQRRKILTKNILEFRKNRRQKLPRAFENAMFRFEIVSSYAVYRDLHRHRLLTFHRQKLNPYLGYYIPDEIKQISRQKEFKEVLETSKRIYELIYEKLPNEAQYVLNFAYNYRYQLYLNFRELAHIIELRTIPQGNPEYRLICQKMFKEIKRTNNFLSQFIKFVDLNNYKLERLKSEIRKEIKVNENRS